MLGSFNEEALEKYAEKAAEKAVFSFSEGDLYDFTRCVRPDGSAYGTGGSCRKGTEGEKEIKEKAAKKETTQDKVQKLTDALMSRAEENSNWSNELHAAALAERLGLGEDGEGGGATLFLETGMADTVHDFFKEKAPEIKEEDINDAVRFNIYKKASEINPKKVTGEQLADMFNKEHVYDPDVLADLATEAGVSKKAIREAMEMIE